MVFVTDKYTEAQFLVDPGADLCGFPRSRIKGNLPKSEYELYAANGTRIATYGTLAVKVNFSLRREFAWHIVVADVETLIIGIDFLVHYNLLIDLRNRRLIDATTNLSTYGQVANENLPSVKIVAGDSPYHRLLAEFPDLTRPAVFRRGIVKHSVVHHIETTPGPPVFSRRGALLRIG